MAFRELHLGKRSPYHGPLNPPHPIRNFVPVLASQVFSDEIIRKRKNREEIRNLYNCYRKIRFCTSRKDPRFTPDIEEAYLSLITASRGCTSAQRIVAELLPCYASYCPTALEAAVKVVINMYHWNFGLILRGEDVDGVAFLTAKACICGLVDICLTAASVGSTSSVIGGICSAVFRNVLIFFFNVMEGADIFLVDHKEVAEVQESTDLFCELIENMTDRESAPLSKLFKFRMLCVIKIFFSSPKHVLSACFELFESAALDVAVRTWAHYFLRQVVHQRSMEETTLPPLDKTVVNAVGEEKLPIGDGHANVRADHSLMGMAVKRSPSLGVWFLSHYKKMCKSIFFSDASEISSYAEKFLESLEELIGRTDDRGGERDGTDLSEDFNEHYKGCHKLEGSFNMADSISNTTTVSEQLNDGSPAGSKSVIDTQSMTKGSNQDHDCSALMSVLKTQEDKPSETMNSEIKNAGLLTVATSPKQCIFAKSHAASQCLQLSDGDPMSLDVFLASKKLWVGSVCPSVSEATLKMQFEEFGEVKLFTFCPLKGFAIIEYKNIKDSIKVRTCMNRSSQWGDPLCVRFIDSGFDSSGSFNGTSTGDSHYVYIGNVQTQSAKEQIMHKLMRAGVRTSVVADACSESVMVMVLECESAKEASVAVSFVRTHRKENGYYTDMVNAGTSSNLLVKQIDPSVLDEELINAFSKFGDISGWQFKRSNGCCSINFRSSEAAAIAKVHLDGASFGTCPIHVEFENLSRSNPPTSMIVSPNIPLKVGCPSNDRKKQIPHVSSLLESLRIKYNISYLCGGGQMSSSMDGPMGPTDVLWMTIPDVASTNFMDDDIAAVCNVAAANSGSVIRVTRASTYTGFCWFVQFSSIEAATIAMQNILTAEGSFFQIVFRNSATSAERYDPACTYQGDVCSSPLGNQSVASVSMPVKSGITGSEHFSSSIHMLNDGHLPIQMFTCTDMAEGGSWKADGIESARVSHCSGGGEIAGRARELPWVCKRAKMEHHISTQPTKFCLPTVGASTTVPVHVSSFMPPVCQAPPSSWDSHYMNSSSLSNISSGIVLNNYRASLSFPHTVPPSTNALSQLPDSSVKSSGVARSTITSLSSSATPPEIQLSVHPSSLPLNRSHPSFTLPSPTATLLPQGLRSSAQTRGQCLQYQWQGALCKSGVQFCTVFSCRESSACCKYANGLSEPIEWPGRLDMTKRTDIQQVKTTFNGIPSHKKEVCRLLPSTSSDDRGFQEFISYLRRRECAGVIKISAGTSIWARLLFILPYSTEICEMLSIPHHPPGYLVALILPKERSFYSV